jgi:endonuclease G
MLNGTEERTNNFRFDPDVSTGSASLSNYKGSGFDRGHLAPAGDMKVSHVAMSESFYMSNMSPQTPSFNRGGWKRLESLVRQWANIEGDIYIVTGGILSSNIGHIGSSSVTIPKYYYKIIYSPKNKKMIGFKMPNEKISDNLKEYVVKVDVIEAATQIDFFPQLEDGLENELESNINIGVWNFSKTYSSTDKKTKSKSLSSRCKGIAKSTGSQCKNNTKNSNSYCYVHQSQSPDYVKPKTNNYTGRCNAITKAGPRCKRNASGGSRYCW